MISSEESRKCIQKVIDNLKVKGTFDQLRRECMADVDIKPSYNNLLQRVEGYVSKFLYRQQWNAGMNKNQLRNRLRNEIHESDMLKNGIRHLIDQVVTDKIKKQFEEKIEEALHEYLGITKEEEEEKPESEIDMDVEQISPETTESDAAKFDVERLEEPVRLPPTQEDVKDEKIDVDVADQKDFPVTQEVPPREENDQQVVDNEDNKSNHDNEDMDIDECLSPLKVEKLTPEVSPLPVPVKEENVDEVSNESFSLIIGDEPSPPSPPVSVSESEPTKNDPEEEKEEVTAKWEDTDNDGGDEEPIIEMKKEEKSPMEKANDSVKDQPETIEPQAEVKQEEQEEEQKLAISDVSSVHTSDLSDFDDQISIDSNSGDDIMNKKKKISIKVVKELAASITVEQKQLEKPVAESKLTKPGSKSKQPTAKTNKGGGSKATPETIAIEPEEEQNPNKRKRKRNPKFMSAEYSYDMDTSSKSTASKRNAETVPESGNETKRPPEVPTSIDSSAETKKINNNHQNNLKRKRGSSSCSNTAGAGSSKVSKHQQQQNASAKNSAASAKKPSLDSGNTNKTKKNSNSGTNNSNKTKQQQQQPQTSSGSRTQDATNNNKRYDSSDLYKPRHRLSSSRRGRGPATPESNSNSNDEKNGAG